LTIWVVAAGRKGRDYSKYFFKYGMLFIGGVDYEDKVKNISIGDIILLKKGASKVIAVGKAIERNGEGFGIDNSGWLSDFDGWELKFYHHVEWYQLEKPKNIVGKFRGRFMKSITYKEEHEKFALDIINNQKPLNNIEKPKPDDYKKVNDDQIINHLIREGLRPGNAEDLIMTFGRIRRLAKYYRKENIDVKEHETRTFLVIPLLMALGWSEQQIKIEHSVSNNSIDIACFDKPFHKKNKKCELILETKKISSGLDYAEKQAISYAENFSKLNFIVLTNGFCYKIFKINKNEDVQKKYKIFAYLNLLQPRESFHLDPQVKGAKKVFSILCPSV